MDSSPDHLRDIFLGRQPILDKSEMLVGYELLFRPTRENVADIHDPQAATADVVCKAFAELGLPNVLGRVRTFINVDARFLSDDAVELLPKSMVVFELDAATLADDEVLARCRQLKAGGYSFSVAGLHNAAPVQEGKTDFASYLKIDLKDLPPDQLQSVASELRTTRLTLVACGVETQTQMEFCTLVGFQLFQGYYFAKPTIIEGRSLDASTLGVFRIIQLLASDAETSEIEEAFRSEPALVINLLHLTNSVGVGSRVRITSVRQAITTIGRRQLQRWLQLLIFSRNGEPDMQRNPLMQYAALRGRFMELLAQRLHPEQRDLPDSAFITGLMSVMPAALGMSMSDILSEVTLTDAVRSALLARQGVLGDVLKLTEHYDDNDVAAVQAMLPEGTTLSLLGEILSQALSWVQQLDEAQA